MTLQVQDMVSSAAGLANEDRAGASGALAWVIDGATDVLTEKLTDAPSDSAWIAEFLDQDLRVAASSFDEPLTRLPARLAQNANAALKRIARRAPEHRFEHPSAAGIVVRSERNGLSYLSLGDCALIARSGGDVFRVGVDEHAAGDTWVRESLNALRAADPSIDQSAARASLWPKLRAARLCMNVEGGYGVFSITAPPDSLIISGHIPLDRDCEVLLASDGLMRLVEIFHNYTAETLLDAALKNGLAALIAELRQLETSDAQCIQFPRAKTSDDATGLLLRYVAG